jgi:hypothetical protein
MRDFSEALFRDHPEDVVLMRRHCTYHGWDYDEVKSQRRAFFYKSVRRIIPGPLELHGRVKEVFDAYKDARDSKTNNRLFSPAAESQAANVLKLIQDGLVSDPADIPLYYVESEDEFTSLRTYWCVRGTNFVEGGVHQKIIRSFGSFNAGPALADALLAEDRHRHNHDMAVARRHSRDPGHYDVWLLDSLKSVTSALMMDEAPFTDYMATYEFRATQERYGIVPQRDINGFEPFDRSFKQNPSFYYLSKKLETKYPILPVHTSEEKRLFKTIYETDVDEPISSYIRKFSELANGQDIYYKMESHIREYRKKFEKALAARDSVRLLGDQREQLRVRRDTNPVQVSVGSSTLLEISDQRVSLRHLKIFSVDTYTYSSLLYFKLHSKLVTHLQAHHKQRRIVRRQ